LQRAEAEQKSQKAEAERREVELRKAAADAQARERADEERRGREAEAEQRRAEDERLRGEADSKRRAETEERRPQPPPVPRSAWQPSLRAAAIGSLVGAVVLGIGVWLVTAPPKPVPPPTPVAPAVPVAPAPVPAAPAPVTVAPTSGAGSVLSPAGERALKPKDTFEECKNCPEMIVVPAGSFTMGSAASEPGRNADEGPQHTVTFTRQFAVGRFAVTVDEFSAFVKETGYDAGSSCWTFEGGKDAERQGRSWRDPGFDQAGSHPAACVNWNDAKAYASWLSRKTGKDYRLPTEAEYEYGTRARTSPGPAPRYFFGDNEASMCRYGNGADQTAKDTIPGADKWIIFPCSDGYAYTAPVGSFLPNGFGLYDMHGNIFSWTEDCYHDSYSGAPTDGTAWRAGDCSSRVLRGGSWNLYPGYLRSAVRASNNPDVRYMSYGFRLVRTLVGP
jgi:formylglycine-generating enzyme required for sulfatase activity